MLGVKSNYMRRQAAVDAFYKSVCKSHESTIWEAFTCMKEQDFDDLFEPCLNWQSRLTSTKNSVRRKTSCEANESVPRPNEQCFHLVPPLAWWDRKGFRAPVYGKCVWHQQSESVKFFMPCCVLFLQSSA